MKRSAALALAALTALLAAPAVADPTPSPTDSTETLPVTVTLDRMRPVAPQPGDTVVIDATLRNVTAEDVSDLAVHLDVSRTKVGTRGQFDEYADAVDGPPPLDAVELSTARVDLASSSLGAGQAEHVTVSVPVADLDLPENWQVYEMALSVDGLTRTGEETVGRLHTFLPWAPVGIPGVGSPIQLAWVWPLVDRPHRVGDTTWTDDDLAGELGPSGRLRTLVDAGAAAESQQPSPPPPPPRKHRHRHRPKKVAPPRPTVTPVPLTWAIDPMLVDDADRMAAGYTVDSSGEQRPGAGKAVAKSWLDELKAAAGKGEVLALPYADPDIVAAARWGLDNEVQVATNSGADLLEHALSTPPLDYSWPPDGLADQRTLDTLFAGGVTTVVLDSAALPPTVEPNETPGAKSVVTSRDGHLTALLADHTLTSAVEAGALAGQGPLAVQRVLSELLMIQAEQPFEDPQRSLVVAPDRRWAPAAGYAAALLADTGKVPWVQPVPLSSVADGPVYDKVARNPFLTYPADERLQQLHRGYLASVAALKARVDAFAQILPRGNPLQARAFDSGILRLLSSAWRSAPDTARDRRDQLGDLINATMNKVRIASHGKSLVTLTSHSGTVPVTVTNELDTPVRVVVVLEPDQHLTVKNGRVAKTIQPHRQIPVDVRATAKTSGVFTLTVSLYTPAGVRYGPRVHLSVRSTAYGATALLITGGATAMLLLAVAVRLGRRARTARRAARSGA